MTAEEPEQVDEPARRAAMSVRGAALIGTGSMVGAGILVDVLWHHVRDRAAPASVSPDPAR